MTQYAEAGGAVYADAVGAEGCRLPSWSRGPSTPLYMVPEGRTPPCRGTAPVEGSGGSKVMARVGVNSLFKNSTNLLEQEVSK